ncbi:serine hydrolase domain-containing protein [Hyphococcus sp.]|uniref:serine hydrolase domain-containing protein n=1 Tax=Hyphococcus sp. TaxID=2038636 RepID=UPI003D0DC4C3
MQVNRRAFMGGATVAAGLAVSAQAKTRKSGGGAAQQQALSKLQNYADRHCADWGLPGMTACMVDSDGFTGFATSGFADIDRKIPVGPDHLFQVGSITKMMTSLAAWSLIDEGKLSPDARLKELMPEIPVRGGEAITLQHLLNHTSGLPNGTPLFVDGGLWTGSEPGTYWAYSNLGYRIAGKIIERVDGRLFPEALEARVLRPIGMEDSVGALRKTDERLYAQGYQPALLDRPHMRPGRLTAAPWVDYDGASGCAAATAGDMALFLRFLLGLAAGEGGPVFSDATAARFMAYPAAAPGWSGDARYGNGIAHVNADGRAYLHHTGGMVSFSSSLHVDPAAGVACFASSNIHYAHNYRPRQVSLYGCELLQAAREGTDFPDAAPTKPTVDNPAQFAGIFTAENGDSFEIVAMVDSVAMSREGSVAIMQPVGAAYFACEHAAFDVTGLEFDVEDGRAFRAWAGGVEYLADPSKGYAQTPREIKALEGRYDSDDRWALPSRVYARGEKLSVRSANYRGELVKADNGDWRAEGDEPSAGWVRFDHILDGKPQRMVDSGEISVRRFS